MIEHVVVVSGELEMKLEGKWQTISADSGVRFAGDKPHAYRNSSDRTAFSLPHSLSPLRLRKTVSLTQTSDYNNRHFDHNG